MKRILGLDLGVGSIGWALVNEAENKDEKSSIIKIGVRVNPLTVDEQTNFEAGKTITTNANRTLKRTMRRNLQRFKLRRADLIKVLKEYHFIKDDTLLNETGNRTTFETYHFRAKAASEEISLEQFARVLLMINKKRGYKSNRKVNNSKEESGQLIDGMSIAKILYEDDITPCEYMLKSIRNNTKKDISFYRSDLQTELNRIWNFQQQFHPEILTENFKNQITGKSQSATSRLFGGIYQISTAENKGKEKVMQSYKWRVDGLTKELSKEILAYVISNVNGEISNSSGYLGAISDRSKRLIINKQTVGQYLMDELDKNANASLTNQVFYRQDYLDEFEKIWETQAQFHSELTPELKREIRDIIIFYQRNLRSQKGLVSFCEFESRKKELTIDGKKKMKIIGYKVCPKSSPVFQEFKIWQTLNNIKVLGKGSSKKSKKTTDDLPLFAGQTVESNERYLNLEEKKILFSELNIKKKMTKDEILKLLFTNYKELDLNFKEIEGNDTQAELYNAYQKIIETSGHEEHDFTKMPSSEIMELVSSVFNTLGIETKILHLDFSLNDVDFQKQPAYKLWHLLYSFIGDNSRTGNEKLIDKISDSFHMDPEYAKIIAGITFKPDYGNLSTKAIRKILPFMKNGEEYSVACEHAGYRHSKNSLTKDEIEKKTLKDHLDLLPRNSLRNPVVEKILNQMINVVNAIISTYGKPDEIRVELARELKKNAKERELMSKNINASKAEYEQYRELLHRDFGILNVSKNDILRYRLYQELKLNDYKTLYSDQYIPQEKLFSKEIDIEHIIPQAKLFDDSYSNKTLEYKSVNIEKADMTAIDFVSSKYGESGLKRYEQHVNFLFANQAINKTKKDKLLTIEDKIPKDFIERDLRDSQYIAIIAKEILEELVRFVVPTTGSITDRLREDWQLIDVMQELNWDKYDKLGLTEIIEDKDGRRIRRIKDWTKRNDHRHHAMDALTIAFTKRSIIQYLNNLNARSNKSSSIYGIEQNELYRDNHGKLRFVPPMPLDEFRNEAKCQLMNILVSIKAKNKVMTQNTNITKTKKGTIKKIQLTPRGQLHNETIYGQIKQYVTKLEKIGSAFDAEKIATVTLRSYQEALLNRLKEYDNDPKKAFTGKNSLDKKPIFLNESHTQKIPEKVKTVTLEPVYTIRKEIGPDLKVEKVVDIHIRQILRNRLEENGNDSHKAFSNLAENPIWLNKEKGIAIKRVKITGVSNAVALRDKRDQLGEPLLDNAGNKQPVDYVSTSNNHHVAIFKDANGDIQEHIISFYEATIRESLRLPIIDREYKNEEGWQFLFSMKQNEYFIFPNKETGFDPKDIDLLNPLNFAIISPNLYRVQKFTTKDYFFRHHLETTVEDKSELRGIAFKRINSLNALKDIVKVRVNHIGQIVFVGEY